MSKRNPEYLISNVEIPYNTFPVVPIQSVLMVTHLLKHLTTVNFYLWYINIKMINNEMFFIIITIIKLIYKPTEDGILHIWFKKLRDNLNITAYNMIIRRYIRINNNIFPQ